MKGDKDKYYAAVGLVLILGISLALHLFNIGYPAAPAFDEAHFTTYAGDYLDHQAFYDIHPPLGKLIYASVLFLASGGTRFSDYQFVKYNPDSHGGPLYVETGMPYESFPYIPLRVTSSIFGLLLVAAFYLFLRSIGMGTAGALLGAFFVAFENAIVLQTRLIFIDGMYLAFGLFALAFYFKKPRWVVIAGIFFALALSVKLIAVIFAGPVIVDYFLRKKEEGRRAWTDMATFFIVAGVVFALIASLNLLFFSPSDILAIQNKFNIPLPAPSSPQIALVMAFFASTVAPWTGYLVNGVGLYHSAWYMWPFMQVPMPYYVGMVDAAQKLLVLAGNPVVWLGGTISVLIGLAALLRPVFKERKGFEHATVTQGANGRSFALLFGGYAFALLPYFTIVRRDTFLYHYFPGLLFAIGLLAWFVARWLKLEKMSALTKAQWLWIAGIAFCVIVGFFSVAPLTYGL